MIGGFLLQVKLALVCAAVEVANKWALSIFI